MLYFSVYSVKSNRKEEQKSRRQVRSATATGNQAHTGQDLEVIHNKDGAPWAGVIAPPAKYFSYNHKGPRKKPGLGAHTCYPSTPEADRGLTGCSA